jgi:hypothetical protein
MIKLKMKQIALKMEKGVNPFSIFGVINIQYIIFAKNEAITFCNNYG